MYWTIGILSVWFLLAFLTAWWEFSVEYKKLKDICLGEIIRYLLLWYITLYYLFVDRYEDILEWQPFNRKDKDGV